MLTYAETARSSTIVPLAPVSQGQRQQDTAHYVSSAFSYAIGPIDPAQLITMHAHLSDGEEHATHAVTFAILDPQRPCLSGWV